MFSLNPNENYVLHDNNCHVNPDMEEFELNKLLSSSNAAIK